MTAELAAPPPTLPPPFALPPFFCAPRPWPWPDDWPFTPLAAEAFGGAACCGGYWGDGLGTALAGARRVGGPPRMPTGTTVLGRPLSALPFAAGCCAALRTLGALLNIGTRHKRIHTLMHAACIIRRQRQPRKGKCDGEQDLTRPQAKSRGRSRGSSGTKGLPTYSCVLWVIGGYCGTQGIVWAL